MLRDYKMYYFRQMGFVILLCKHSDLLVSRYFVRFSSCCCSLEETNANCVALIFTSDYVKSNVEAFQGLKNYVKSKERRWRRIWKLSKAEKITWNQKKDDDAFGSFPWVTNSKILREIKRKTITTHLKAFQEWKITWNRKKDDAVFQAWKNYVKSNERQWRRILKLSKRLKNCVKSKERRRRLFQGITDEFKKLREIKRKITMTHLEAFQGITDEFEKLREITRKTKKDIFGSFQRHHVHWWVMTSKKIMWNQKKDNNNKVLDF